jgi:hypothetical protein
VVRQICRFLEFACSSSQIADVVGCLQAWIPEDDAVLPRIEDGHVMDPEETLGTAVAWIQLEEGAEHIETHGEDVSGVGIAVFAVDAELAHLETAIQEVDAESAGDLVSMVADRIEADHCFRMVALAGTEVVDQDALQLEIESGAPELDTGVDSAGQVCGAAGLGGTAGSDMVVRCKAGLEVAGILAVEVVPEVGPRLVVEMPMQRGTAAA